MLKFRHPTFLFFAVLFAIPFSENVAVADNNRKIDALDTLRQCAENLKITDRVQYKVNTRCSHQASVPWGGNSLKQHVEAVIKRDGDKIEVIGIERQYKDGKHIKDEKIHRVSTPDFGIYAINRGDGSETGMVTTNQTDRLLAPILCGGRFGFELDGYIGDGVRVLTLMLMEPDKVKYIGEKEVNGIVCQQIDADTKYGFLSVYIDTHNNHAVHRVVSEKRQNDLQYGGERYFQNMPQAKTFTETIDNLEFNLIENVNFPVKGNLQVVRKDKNGDTYASRSEYERKDIDLSPAFGKDTFSAEFLKGEVVSNLDDNESGVVYVWDGEKPVPGYTMLEGTAVMQGYAGFARFCLMLLGIVLIGIALYRILRRK